MRLVLFILQKTKRLTKGGRWTQYPRGRLGMRYDDILEYCRLKNGLRPIDLSRRIGRGYSKGVKDIRIYLDILSCLGYRVVILKGEEVIEIERE